MKVKAFLLAGVAGAAVSPALAPEVGQAADLAVKAPPPPPPVVATWNGWYIGVNAGAVVQSGTDDYRFTDCNSCDNFTGSETGFIGGGQIGYNWQTGSVVYGLEGDISGLTGTVNLRSRFADTTYTSRISWLSTVRGRVGLAVGDTMAYVTAGLAIAGVRNENTFANNSATSYSDTSTRLGLAVGGGVEHMWNRNWSVKLEGLWVDTGHRDVGQNGNASKVSRFGNQAVIARAGLNYRF